MWLIMASTVPHGPLRFLLCSNAAVSLAYHMYRLTLPCPNALAHATPLLKVDAVGATLGAGVVFLIIRRYRLPLLACAAFSGSSWIDSLDETTRSALHFVTHTILTTMAVLYFTDFTRTRGGGEDGQGEGEGEGGRTQGSQDELLRCRKF